MKEMWFEPGHVAIVTGGSQGLGKALARGLLQRGITVIIDGRRRVELNAAAGELRPLGELVAIPGDVADASHIHALVECASERFGRLDLVVNNASTLGETPLRTVRRLSPDELQRVFAVNLFAPVHLMYHALPLLERSGGPATIVNITSDAGVEAYPTWGAYGASKAALEHISGVFAAELGDSNVRVLVVDPGDMNTEMHRAAVPDADAALLRNPAEVAEALLHIIADLQTPYARVALELPQPV